MIIVIPFLKVAGMALFPFILVKNKHLKNDKVLINHEKIHLRQQLETAVLPFYVLYLGSYLVNLIKHKNHHQAYIHIFFEKEAYHQEKDLNYLKKRKFWNFLKYI